MRVLAFASGLSPTHLLEGPNTLVFDDMRRLPDGNPGYFLPYFQREPLMHDDPADYVDRTARLQNSRQVNWIHPLGSTVTALLDAGLRLEWLHEHDAITWQMFAMLVEGQDGLYRWPDKPPRETGPSRCRRCCAGRARGAPTSRPTH